MPYFPTTQNGSPSPPTTMATNPVSSYEQCFCLGCVVVVPQPSPRQALLPCAADTEELSNGAYLERSLKFEFADLHSLGRRRAEYVAFCAGQAISNINLIWTEIWKYHANPQYLLQGFHSYNPATKGTVYAMSQAYTAIHEIISKNLAQSWENQALQKRYPNIAFFAMDRVRKGQRNACTHGLGIPFLFEGDRKANGSTMPVFEVEVFWNRMLWWIPPLEDELRDLAHILRTNLHTYPVIEEGGSGSKQAEIRRGK